MRRGEILALRWADIDFEKQAVDVHRTVDYIGKYGYVETEPKTAAGRRTVALAPFVVDKLKQHRIEQLETKVTLTRFGGSAATSVLLSSGDQDALT